MPTSFALQAPLPQRLEPTPEGLGLLRKETMGDARRALRQVGGAFAAGRRQPRTPARQRLMRYREPLEHFEVLAPAELRDRITRSVTALTKTYSPG